jgi:hypothetical protein
MSRQNRKQVERLIAGMNAGNAAVFEQIFHDDAVIDWPQFGERIIGAVDRRKVYESLPTMPDVHIRRIFGGAGVWIVEALMVYGGDEHHVVSIFEFRDGQIERETSYWAEPKAGGAGWKKKWVHPLEAISRVPEPDELDA